MKYNLPKVYNNEGGKFPEFLGMPKISYSQYSSWKNPDYRNGYIAEYIFGIKQPTNEYANFGGECGKFIECTAMGLAHPSYSMLSEEDKSILANLDYPENSLYENEIVIDAGGFVIQGFEDRLKIFDDLSICVCDFKTGNTDTKKKYYSDESFNQTTLYAHFHFLQGVTVNCSEVILLGRKGNNRPNHPIRLSGEIVTIDTPFSEERALLLMEDFRKVAKEISACYTLYQKLNKLK